MNNEFLKDYPELEKLFQRLVNEPDSKVFAPLADSCRKIGHLEEALYFCQDGVARHPEYASGQVVLGKCYFDMGDEENAKTAFQEVLSLDENNLVALKYLGMILVEQGDQRAAMEHFKHILALDPENLEIRSKLESLQETEAADSEPVSEEDEEIVLLDEVLDEEFEGTTIQLGDDQETSDELATLTLADIYASQGYLHKAKGIYEEVLRKWPDHSQAKEKLAALEREKANAISLDENFTGNDEDFLEEEPLLDEDSNSITACTDMSIEPGVDEAEQPPAPGDQDLQGSDKETSSEENTLDSGLNELDTANADESIENGRDIDKFRKWLERMSD
jgi:tetratricopeptide (TPR) repeat protein